MVKVVKPGDDKKNGEISPHEFEQMLAGSMDPEMVYPGEIVSGTVVSVGRDWVFVDIGGKSEGMIAGDEFVDEDDEVKIGDVVEATVLTTRGGIRLSRSLRKSSQSDEVLQDAYENRIPVEGRVMEVRKGGFGIAIGSGHTAFCPISQIDARYVEKPEDYLEQALNFRIIEFSSDLRNIVVSRRILLEEEQQAQARQTRERLKPGAILEGDVKKVMPYGAFVGVGGLDGLVHVSEISWDRVEDPTQHLTEGQRVTVKVLDFDIAKDKLSLSIREAGSDPWDDVEKRFPTGTTMAGTVMRVEPYGAFVRIATGIEGLVHVSDMTWVGRVRHASDVANVGDSVQVAVLNVDRERKRISLGMKQIQGDPFDLVTDKYKPGEIASGTVQRTGAGGVFIQLQEGIVAFLPGSLAGLSRGEPLGSIYKTGKQVRLLVKEVDAERRRITLEAGQLESREERSDFEQYMAKQGVSKLGSFGEAMQKAMDKQTKK